MTEPASIRFNNPGAMWGGNRIAKRWGATANVVLNDGLGQGNTIAFFPTVVQGGAAQFDLWRSNYCNLTLDAAIKKWSGGNSSIPYMNFLCQRTGLTFYSVITSEVLAGPTGLALLKAQAQWEAGHPYPMTDDQWKSAQRRVFVGSVSPASKKIVVAATGTTSTVAVAVNAHQQGASPIQIIVMIVALLAMTGLIYYLVHRSSK